MNTKASRPSIAFENVIRFPRMLAQNIIGYEVTVKEEVREGVFAEYVLPTVPNPISPTPIQHKEEFECVSDGVFQLPSETYFSPDNIVEIFVNGNKVDDIYTTFNDNTKIFRVNTASVELSKDDLIEIQYYKDEIVIRHSAINKCTYSVKPVLDKKYVVGDHNILR